MKKILFFLSGGLDLSKGRSGIGPNSWGWWRIFLPKQKKFYQYGCNHDNGYTEGGTDLDRYQLDQNLLRDCTRASLSENDIRFAKIYYFLVRVFGEYYFNYKTTEK